MGADLIPLLVAVVAALAVVGLGLRRQQLDVRTQRWLPRFERGRSRGPDISTSYEKERGSRRMSKRAWWAFTALYSIMTLYYVALAIAEDEERLLRMALAALFVSVVAVNVRRRLRSG